ncbi:DUF4145 domain-containing protein [Corallococcus terminator]
MPENETVKVVCVACGGKGRNHKVLREHINTWEDLFMWGGEKYQIVQCLGCDAVRFRAASWDSENLDPNEEEHGASIKVYPEFAANSREAVIADSAGLPLEVYRIYKETVLALNAGTLILAGAGLRAIVEAICLNASAPGGNLQQKINGLVSQNLLAQPQADLLHEERYLGNAAIHEVEPPSRKDVEDGLAIVETLLNTIYIAPASAARLREGRIKKQTQKARAAARASGAKKK